MKLFTTVLSLAVLSACSVTEQSIPEFTAVPDSNLQQMQDTRFDHFVIDPQADFSKYDKVIFFPTQFDKLTIDEGADNQLTNSWNASTWDEMDKICQFFDDFAQLTFAQKSGLEPTNRGGENVMAIEFRLINFMPYQRRYQDADRDTVALRGQRNGLGSITFQAVVANSKTGELLAVIEDGMELNPGNMLIVKGDPNLQVDSASRMAQNVAWRKTFKRIANRLHEDLMRLKQS